MAAIRSFNDKLLLTAANRNFWLKPLGVVDGYITWLVMTRKPIEASLDVKNLLVMAGVHGEEHAGPIAILQWLQEVDELTLASVNISFVPIVNSYGFANKKRYGLSDVPTNGGFGSNKTQDPSPEGQILVNNIGILQPLAADGFLSLHEDSVTRESYIYTMEKTPEPGPFTKGMKRELAKYFPRMYNGIAYIGPKEKGPGPQCKRGLVYNFMDESFESLLFQLGVPRCAVPETPAKYKLKKRVEAQKAMIYKFIELSLKE